MKNRNEDISKYDSNKVVPGIIFDENWREKAIGRLEEVNKEDCFVISKLTAGGKFVRGEHLFYKMRGIEVYTDINNIIFVDLHNNTLFIKEFAKIEKNINTKNPEERQYIILYTDLGFNDDYKEFPLRWEAYTGRQKAYEAIKLNAPVIDIDSSIVLVETAPLKDALTVRAFVNYLQNASLVKEDNFDINNFAGDRFV